MYLCVNAHVLWKWINETCADWRQYVQPKAFLLYKGTPVVTAGYMLGFLPQRVGCLTLSCAHTHTHIYQHRQAQIPNIHICMIAHMNVDVCTCTGWCMHRPAGTDILPSDSFTSGSTSKYTHARRIRHKLTNVCTKLTYTYMMIHTNIFYRQLSVYVCLYFCTHTHRHAFAHSGCPWRLPFVKNTLNHNVAKPLTCTNTHSDSHTVENCVLESPRSFPLQHRGSVAHKLKLKFTSVCMLLSCMNLTSGNVLLHCPTSRI